MTRNLKGPMPVAVWAWVRANLASNVFISIGMATGGVAALIARREGVDPWSTFVLAACIPPGPLAFLFATDWMMERKLRRLKRWRDDGVIDQDTYQRRMEQSMEWWAERWFGKDPRAGQ